MLKPHWLQVTTAVWQVLFAKFADGIATCYNNCWQVFICQVADGIATVGWMCMVDDYDNWQMEKAKGLFNLV